jgi:hypothetical protein
MHFLLCMLCTKCDGDEDGWMDVDPTAWKSDRVQEISDSICHTKIATIVFSGKAQRQVTGEQ